ncbi:MAG: nickel pincer cofactor biosynthesis protein LarB [Chloroflexota bacterium]|nr:nickel pincer cofactor biosynthesis protein LarB [Chloroflexota bacterium]
MDGDRLRSLLEQLHDGRVDVAAAMERLRDLPYEDVGFAKLDHHRQLRRGFAEVILGQGKTVQQMAEIARKLAQRHSIVMATRVEPAAAEAVISEHPRVEYHAEARLLAILQPDASLPEYGDVAVVSAGTADLPVAEEAALTAHYMGNRVTRLYDVGVSGLHRLLAQRDRLDQARVIVVVAGMDAALAAVVSGLVRAPVVAVPTSVGYGAHLDGLAPLLTMLNSCSSGVGVVNIDNGFGAGYLASQINHVGCQD